MAKKLKSSLLNMFLSLTVISAVASGLLAVVNNATAGKIAEGEMKAKQDGLLAVTPQFDNDPFAEVVTVQINGTDVLLYPARQGEELVGVAAEVLTHAGYGGDISLLIGLNPEDFTVINYSVLSHSETPGLGDRMEEWFRVEGTNQSVLGVSLAKPIAVTKDGGTIDAISAATITSRAFVGGLNTASAALRQAQEQGLL
ncbi:MAG: RnfABCDGE type electron transport complex subunit G [Porphyromonas sp.]|nr:RnfABCDGE type electron transport complex subunit G [Porphyromonas sp.]